MVTTNMIESWEPSSSGNRLSMTKQSLQTMLVGLSPEDQDLFTQFLTEPLDYVDHPGFAKRGIEKNLFGAPAAFQNRNSTRFRESRDDIVDAVQAGERLPALTQQQEEHLFMRFNYARRCVLEILEYSKGKKLSVTATRRLLAWGHRVLAARSVIVRINLPLVLAMAKRTRLSNIDFNEMVSEGNMALLRSVEKFDCSRGYKFSTYSCRAILKSFSRVAMRASRYRGQFPTEFDPSMERSDHLDRVREGVERDCVDELKAILLDNLAGLSEVEQTVIKARFAMGRDEIGYPIAPKTLEQVGMMIGVTKERVRQIQNKALRKIRTTLENRFLAA